MLSQNRILRNAILAILPLSTLVVVAGAAASDQGSSYSDPKASVEVHASSSSTGDDSPSPGDEFKAEQTSEISSSVEHQSTVSSSSTSQSSVSVQSSGTGQSQSAEITVNGHSVAVPDSGRVHKTFSDSNGSTTLDVSVDNNTDANSGSSSSMNIQIDSGSSSSGNGP